MKIISELKELEGQTFANVLACAAAEESVMKSRRDAEKAKEKLNASKRKKELADKVDIADADIENAYNEYEKTKDEVRKILEESNEKMCKMLEDATNKIKVAESAKRDAIMNYTKEFGTFQKVYNGDKATKEFKRIEKQLSNSFDNIIDTFLNFKK